jgi:hypothetical protein
MTELLLYLCFIFLIHSDYYMTEKKIKDEANTTPIIYIYSSTCRIQFIMIFTSQGIK